MLRVLAFIFCFLLEISPATAQGLWPFDTPGSNLVPGVQMEVPKIVGYGMLSGVQMQVPKIVGYGMLDGIEMQVPKIVGYALLVPKPPGIGSVIPVSPLTHWR